MTEEIVAALVAGAFAIQSAAIGAVGIIVSRLVRRETASVREQVTPNGGESAHDHLVQRIEDMRDELCAALTRANKQHVADWHK